MSSEQNRPLLSDPEAPLTLSFHSSLLENHRETFFPRVSWPQIRGSHVPTIVMAVYLLSGVAVSYFLGNLFLGGHVTNPIVDSLYFCIVTMTTVGYGGIAIADTLLSHFLEDLLAHHNDKVLAFLTLHENELNEPTGIQYEKKRQFLQKCLSGRTSIYYGEDELKSAWGRVKISALYLFLLVLLGILVLYFLEGLSILDAIYCACVTVTTVGYGDKSFSTLPGRCFAIVWILASTFLVAQLFARLADARATDQQAALAKEVLQREVTEVDLIILDMDNDGKVSPSEFVIQKLVELKKVEQKDIDMLIKRFESYDKDHSGHLDIQDLNQN